jgi:8-oxo-dGTP diphosphatase
VNAVGPRVKHLPETGVAGLFLPSTPPLPQSHQRAQRTCRPGTILVGMPGTDVEEAGPPRISAVGAVITNGSGRILLVQRAHEPEAGRWSLPGGRVEPGESDGEALAREVREETGLIVVPGELLGTVERAWPGGAVLEIRDYSATVAGGCVAAGDDAVQARWFFPAELPGLPLTRGLLETLSGWGVLPPGQPPAAFGGTAEPSPPPALIAEATRRAGVIWLSLPGRARPCPAWHVWAEGAAYVLTGPGEQPLPGLAAARHVTVTVPSKETGGTLLTWQARVVRVEPGSPEWETVIGHLVAARLNLVLAPGEPAPAARWARTGAVFRLAPVTGQDPAAPAGQ